MGIFDIFGSKGGFSFKNEVEGNFPPIDFGFAIMTWSFDLANEFQVEISKGTYFSSRENGCPNYMYNGFTNANVVGLYAASYYTYLIIALKVDNSILNNVKEGILDHISKLNAPEEFREKIMSSIKYCFSHYVKAIYDDILHGIDPATGKFKHGITNVEKFFHEYMGGTVFSISPEGMREMGVPNDVFIFEQDKRHIGDMISNIPITMFSVLELQGLEHNS